MAENDMYDNKRRYETFIAQVDTLAQEGSGRSHRQLFCLNPANIHYFRKLFMHFDTKDLSYIRRNRVIQVLKIVVNLTEKDLVVVTREDIDLMVSHSNARYNSINSKRDFIKDLKCLWRVLFPERDREGRIDDTVTPYPVRHLTKRVSKSQEKLRNDRFTFEEFQKILNFFSGDAQTQAYLMLAFESLGRPQEILYTQVKDYEFYDNFAKVWISSHGKQGTGFLQCIDSYPYVLEWHRRHPLKDNPNAFFFISKGNRNLYGQLKNDSINDKLKLACKTLGIDKRISCYSLKRNGVTFRRKRGDSDIQIQHAARWTSTKQLKIYDMSTQEDALEIELQKRGLHKGTADLTKSGVKHCMFCAYSNGFTADFCANCKRPLDREKVEEMAKAHERMANSELLQRLNKMEKLFESTMQSVKILHG